MTRLNIEGQMVDIDDGFMKMSPEDQNATVQDIAKQMGITPAATGPAPSGKPVSAISAGESLPVIGAYAVPAAAWLRSKVSGGTPAENAAQIQSDINAYRTAHPLRSTVEGMAVGTAPYLLAGEFAGPAKLLGMTGKALQAGALGGVSNAAIGAADAYARGESPTAGAIKGALGGVGGVVLGKAAGRAWDAARDLMPRARVPNQITLSTGKQIPVSEGTITQDPATIAREQGMIGTQQPDATAAEAATKQAIEEAHGDLYRHLGQSPTTATGLQAGQQVSGDLATLEGQRAAREAQTTAAARQGTEDLIRDVGQPPPAAAPPPPSGPPPGAGAAPPPGAAPYANPAAWQRATGGAAPPPPPPPPGVGPIPRAASALDAAGMFGDRIRELFRTARAATNAAFDRFRGTAGAYDPASLVTVGNDMRARLDAPGPDRVSLAPDRTPQAINAINMIDNDVGQLQFRNLARDPNAPPPRPITPDDMNNVLKNLVIYRRQANVLARSTGNFEDARAVGRIIDEFQDWLARKTMEPGAFTGNAQDVLSSLAAARRAHAQERGTFSRRGAGDVVGQFMENVIGKFPGQEMQPEKIVSTLFGSPDNPFASNAVPILTHLRDNVFGANSPEWGQIKSAIIQHLTETPAGAAEPIATLQQAQRIEKLLSHRQLADTLFSPVEQARMRIHASELRAAEPEEMMGAQTVEGIIDRLAGRGGNLSASPEQIISVLKGKYGADVARALQQRLPAETWGQLKQGFLRDAIQESNGAIPWGDQKVGNRIADLLDSSVGQAMYTPTDQQMIRELGDLHIARVPPAGTRNTSASGYEIMRAAKAAGHQVFRWIGASHGLHGYLMGRALDKAVSRGGAMYEAAQARNLFLGRKAALARRGAYYPGKFGAIGGSALTPALAGQSESQ